MRWIDFIILIVSIALIVVVLMQQSKDDINDAFSGTKTELFKNQKSRGFEKFLEQATAVLSILFIILVLAAAVWQVRA
ncbi:MAG: preprotein translocase subunit SecG [Acholeplasmatales bacterium]|nr:preprotein translocase subunit SecG [Acholeplasmatales bacterium]